MLCSSCGRLFLRKCPASVIHAVCLPETIQRRRSLAPPTASVFRARSVTHALCWPFDARRKRKGHFGTNSSYAGAYRQMEVNDTT